MEMGALFRHVDLLFLHNGDCFEYMLSMLNDHHHLQRGINFRRERSRRHCDPQTVFCDESKEQVRTSNLITSRIRIMRIINWSKTFLRKIKHTMIDTHVNIIADISTYVYKHTRMLTYTPLPSSVNTRARTARTKARAVPPGSTRGTWLDSSRSNQARRSTYHQTHTHAN